MKTSAKSLDIFGGERQGRQCGSISGLSRASIVRVVYSDESGTDEKQPITVVAAILLNMDSQWEPVERELSALKVALPRRLLYGQSRELKGSLLFKGLRRKLHRVEPAKAAEALLRVLSVAVKNKVIVFYGAIDRAGRADWCEEHGILLGALQTEEEAAFSECLRRVDGFIHTVMPEERVLWIADRNGFELSLKKGLEFFQLMQRTDLETLTKSYGKVAHASSFADLGLDVSEDRPARVVDTIYFGDSHESLALQLANVCCSTIAQHLLGELDALPFYNLIRNQIIAEGSVILFSDAWRGRAKEHQ
jgi:Protein of unknown function (DUF3800)